MKNSKGFTLVELLAVITILAIIMLVAIPNVISIADRNKKESYIQAAKQMMTQVEYKVRSDTSIPLPNSNQVTIIYLSCISNSELDNGPEGFPYDKNNSFVAIYNVGNTYVYYATLREVDTASDFVQGINLLSQAELNASASIKQVKKSLTNYAPRLGSNFNFTNNAGQNLNKNVIYLCK